MDSARVGSGPHPSITPEQARDIRARAWSFAFRCWQEKKEATGAVGPDNAKEIKSVRATHHYTR